MTLEEVKNWIIDHQHNLIGERYSGIEGAESLREFFLNELYPDSTHRDEYESRNEYMKFAIHLYNSGRIHIILGVAVLVLAPILAVVSKIRVLPFYLSLMVNLYDITTEMDNAVAEYMFKRIQEGAKISVELYNEAYRATFDAEKRSRQIECNVRLFEFVKSLIDRGGTLITLIEHCPKVPIMTHNHYIQGINQSISFGQRGFAEFKAAKGKLDLFKLILIEKEYGYICDIMGFKSLDEIPKVYIHAPMSG